MCCHSSPWVSSKTLHVWMGGNAADLTHELQIVSISWNLLQKSNVYKVWRSRRNTKGNGLSVCPVEWAKSFLPVLAQMSQASKRYLAESEPKNKLAHMWWLTLLTKTCHRLPNDNTASNLQLSVFAASVWWKHWFFFNFFFFKTNIELIDFNVPVKSQFPFLPLFMDIITVDSDGPAIKF